MSEPRTVMSEDFEVHPIGTAAELARLRAQILAPAETNKIEACPKCGSHNYEKRHHVGNFLAPECHWHECADCGHKTEPS